MRLLYSLGSHCTSILAVNAALTATQTSTNVILQNDRLTANLLKSLGSIVGLTLDGENLLGTRSGSSGIGPYIDCYCIPSGLYTVGSSSPTYQVINGTDSTGTAYGGITLSDTYAPSGQGFHQFWFLRDAETRLHMFSKLTYFNETTSFLRNLQELRTLFRPNTALWTHLSTNKEQAAPLPSRDARSKQVVVQEATWTLENTPNDAYYNQFSEYFTKYSFSNDWRSTIAHGMYADGTASNGTNFGAWLVMNTKGPLHSDLTVDGIVYNYIVSNHHGEGTPHITHGFDRTFGPQYYHFNSGKGVTIDQLCSDAERYTDSSWNAQFYGSIAKYRRWTFEGKINLPKGAEGPVAVLRKSGINFQDNAEDIKAVTVYTDEIFGDFIEDNVSVTARKTIKFSGKWVEESAGTEVWRLGTPGKSSGEFRHGNALDTTHPLQPREHRIYWGAYDFPTDFPNDVNFTIGKSDPTKDFNTVHWSVFWPTHDCKNIEKKTATFTIQLAGAKTAAGNTDVYSAKEPWANLPLTTYVSGRNDGLRFVIPWYMSSSCIVRSAVSCYQVKVKLTFPTTWLRAGENSFVLNPSFNRTNIETAVLPTGVYVQYDALRLELA
ncbi:family 4 polysaccharide lyase [Choiromyces venosus 120613-1]|uniref:Family 4 polysaccharide lyase n=1 Tax=Choiromyces venosus 120613-1 TaxID=1336337 RepID=A0A3N4JZN2_9PEZI|nr:family 4 polysaccharide lyase [Choiromyces venosus 120613-1]